MVASCVHRRSGFPEPPTETRAEVLVAVMAGSYFDIFRSHPRDARQSEAVEGICKRSAGFYFCSRPVTGYTG
ncbi:hypothetical protein PM082_016881 [Marasmius tenuissimus]|nr:hypothetical protein PM082_016881 [Marasmius tenuissimus]